MTGSEIRRARIFCLSLCLEFAPQGTDQFHETGFYAQTNLPAEFCRRGFNSVTTLRASNTVRAGETQKNQNRQYGDKQKRHHTGSFRPRFQLDASQGTGSCKTSLVLPIVRGVFFANIQAGSTICSNLSRNFLLP